MILGLALFAISAILSINGFWLLGAVGSVTASYANVASAIAALVGGSILMAISRGDRDNQILGGVTILSGVASAWSGIGTMMGGSGPLLGWYYLAMAPVCGLMTVRSLKWAAQNPLFGWLGMNWAAWGMLNVLNWTMIVAAWSGVSTVGEVVLADAMLTGFTGLLIVTGRLGFSADSSGETVSLTD